MGPKGGFISWLEKKHGYKPAHEYISTNHTLLVDAKALMHTLAYALPSELAGPELHQALATSMLQKLQHFKQVALVNDGKILPDHPKFQTTCKRREDRARREDAFKKRKLEAEITQPDPFFTLVQPTKEDEGSVPTAAVWPDDAPGMKTMEENFERQARGLRDISRTDAAAVCELVFNQQDPARQSIRYIQVIEGESDQQMMVMADEFDYVVSNDMDILVGGAKKLLYHFCAPNQCVFSITNVLRAVRVSHQQLREIVALSGNDWGDGIYGMGLVNADALIRKYGNYRNMLEKWTYFERKKYKKLPPKEELLAALDRSVNMYDV